MIISDQHRLAFVHIPKCAGSSVRAVLAPLETEPGAFKGVRDHPLLGRLDYGHIPLLVLAEYFPEAFAKVRDYASFALLRDPRERFLSAAMQRLRAHKHVHRDTISRADVERTMAEAVEYLNGRLLVGDPSFIHFERQSTYIELRRQRIVKNLYRVAEIDRMVARMSEIVGQPLELGEREKLSEVARAPPLRALKKAVGPVLGLFPVSLKRRLRIAVYAHPHQQFADLLDRHMGFIRAHYRDDFRLYGEPG